MEMNYNNKTKKWDLKISPLDRCFCCLWKQDCPMLDEIKKGRTIIVNGVMYREECEIYRYDVDEEVEKYLYKDFRIDED